MLELWPASVSHYGPRRTRDMLRHHLVGPRVHHGHMSVLLELAMSAGLRPLTADEAAVSAAASPTREARHALWRYLHMLPGGRSRLLGTATARDGYERLLLNPPVDLAGVNTRPGGLLIAQSMLLGAWTALATARAEDSPCCSRDWETAWRRRARQPGW